MCGGSVGSIVKDTLIGVATGGGGLLVKKGLDYNKRKKASAKRKQAEVRAAAAKEQAAAKRKAVSREPIQTVFAGGNNQMNGDQLG